MDCEWRRSLIFSYKARKGKDEGTQKQGEAFGFQSYEACGSRMRFKCIFPSPLPQSTVLGSVITEFSSHNPLECPPFPTGTPLSSLHSASLADSAFIFRLDSYTNSKFCLHFCVLSLSNPKMFPSWSDVSLTVLREVLVGSAAFVLRDMEELPTRFLVH